VEMPKTREAFKVQARLSTKDERRLKKLVELERVSIADFVRSALLEYMKRKETDALEYSERELVVEFKRGVNRLAGLLAQNYLEVANKIGTSESSKVFFLDPASIPASLSAMLSISQPTTSENPSLPVNVQHQRFESVNRE